MSGSARIRTFVARLQVLLLAPYPIVHVRTWEEARALAIVGQLAGTLGRPVTTWRPESGTPLLDMVHQAEAATDARVWIAVDAHPYMDDPALVRSLRVAARRLHDSGGTLVFVSPAMRAPADLAREWISVEMPLPGPDELRGVLEVALDGLSVPDANTRSRMASAALGLTGAEAHRALERARRMFEQARTDTNIAFDWEAAVIEEKRRLLTDTRALEFHGRRDSMADVGGLDELKAWLGERRNAFGADARRFGLPEPRGLLLVGVQGCGKSLAARAVAGEWGLPLLRLDVAALFSGGEAADAALENALSAAGAIAPCVLWVDEIEKGFAATDSSEGKRLLASLLIWLQEKSDPVFFVATANDVRSMPPELFRRGRFDEVFFVDLPDLRARGEIFALHLNRQGRVATQFDCGELARISENYSGAEIEQIVVAALYTAFAEGRELNQHDLVASTRNTVPLYALYETEIKALRTWSNGRARLAGQNRRLSDYFGGKAPGGVR